MESRDATHLPFGGHYILLAPLGVWLWGCGREYPLVDVGPEADALKFRCGRVSGDKIRYDD